MTSENFDESHEKTGNLKAMFEKKAEEQSAATLPPTKSTAPKANKFGANSQSSTNNTNVSSNKIKPAETPKSPEPSSPRKEPDTTTSHLNKFKQLEQEAEKVRRH
jgi:hypothetical protein